MDIFTLIKSVKLIVLRVYEECNHINQRFLVNKVIALLSFVRYLCAHACVWFGRGL